MKNESILKSSYCQCVGISGTGKGTRVAQFMEFLRATGHPMEFIKCSFHSHSKTTIAPLGVYFPDLNIFILGKWTKSHKSGLVSWTGSDYVNSFMGFDRMVEIIQVMSDTNFIQEGYVGMFSHRLHPDALKALTGHTNFLYHCYDYDTKDEMMDRLSARSGENEDVGAATWKECRRSKTFYDHLLQKKEEMEGVHLQAEYLKYDAPLVSFGRDYLKFVGHSNYIQDFLDYSDKTTTLRSIKTRQENHKNFGWLLGAQNNYKPDKLVELNPARDIIKRNFKPGQVGSKVVENKGIKNFIG